MKKFFIIFLALFAENIFAQYGITITSNYISDDNLFKQSNKIYSNISSSGIGVFYNHFDENSQLKFGYDLGINAYNNFSSGNNNTNTAQIGYAVSSDDEEKLFTVLASYSGKTTIDNFQSYNEKDFSLGASFQFAYNDNHSGDFRYNFNKINYENFSDFNYSESVLGYTSSFNWETKTALFFDMNIGYKIYTTDLYVTTEETTGTSSLITKGKAYGRLKNASGKNSSAKLDGNNLQLLLSGKIAQSIFDNLGSHLSYSFRSNFINNSRAILIDDQYYSDDDIFEDPYGYQGHEFGFGFTYLLPYKISIKTDLDYQIKNYENSYLENSKLLNKKDYMLLFYIRLQKSFSLFENFLEELNVNLNYVFQKNNSNISEFSFSNNIFILGINTKLNF